MAYLNSIRQKAPRDPRRGNQALTLTARRATPSGWFRRSMDGCARCYKTFEQQGKFAT
jgi:protein-arginine kinase activator protein McsA